MQLEYKNFSAHIKPFNCAVFLTHRRADVVRVGELDFSRTDEAAAPTDLAVAKIEVHPDYKPPIFYHDIALIKLKENAPFSKYVQPVCLPPPDNRNLEGAIAVLSGLFAKIHTQKIVLL